MTANIILDEDVLRSTLVLGAIVEARDAYTGGHLWRVAQHSKLIGQRMGMSGTDIFHLTLGAFVHDLGKVGIPDAILQKKGPLTDEEFAIMKTHPVIGADLMEPHPAGVFVLDMVRHHHERVDGAGYPDGLGGDEISLEASIINVADVFDALTSTRPYRAGMSIEEALLIIEQGRGTAHRAESVDALLALQHEGRLAHVVGHSSATRTLVECIGCGPVIVLPDAAKEGDIVNCPSCHGKFQLEAKDHGFTTSMTGEMATAEEFRPQGDERAIHEIIGEIAELGVA